MFDDGSSDNTYAIMNEFKDDCRVRLFRTDGIGLQKICNIALNESNGKYIIRLDGDDVFEPDVRVIQPLDRNSRVGLVSRLLFVLSGWNTFRMFKMKK